VDVIISSLKTLVSQSNSACIPRNVA